ncbi:unnamed protein product [Candidula unifasciata]|uniref:EF-hand domain-containing protein n=1 Tax=Candidula unifasciata TaxID=100452 RepID=A0A8S3ZSS9_9EUPU|nr:unnamed protein product [Candidula unifasciata]
MMAATFLATLLLMLSLASVTVQQPPGVPPRQQPHHGQPPQQHQQPPQQHQQPPQQHQQPPQQHQQPPQQPPQLQQTAPGHGHEHSAPPGGHDHHGKPLEFASEIHNRDHILEHLQKVVATKPKEQLTPEELEFHYFKLHDYDNNNQLDGLEIAKAVTHTHTDQNVTEGSGPDSTLVMSDEQLASTVDGILTTFDHDKNGYVAYFEFKKVSQVSGAGSSQDGA